MGFYRVKDELRYLRWGRVFLFADNIMRKILGPLPPEYYDIDEEAP